MTPELSVLIPAVNTLGDLIDCLERLEDQKPDVTLQVVVVNRIGRFAGAQVKETFPEVEVIDCAPSTTIPQMRATGFRAARGDAIAVIEDHVMVPPGWAAQMLAALETHDALVLAGSVQNEATHTLLDWACFLLEYSHLIPPIAGGKVPTVTGNNVVYRRALIEEHWQAVEAGRWENHLHETIKATGVDLFCCPEIVVGHKKHYTFWEYFSQRYHFARAQAGVRFSDAGRLERLAFFFGSGLLPPLLAFRTAKNLFPKRRYRRLVLQSAPLIGVFIGAWAVGEAVGAILGPGASFAKVR